MDEETKNLYRYAEMIGEAGIKHPSNTQTQVILHAIKSLINDGLISEEQLVDKMKFADLCGILVGIFQMGWKHQLYPTEIVARMLKKTRAQVLRVANEHSIGGYQRANGKGFTDIEIATLEALFDKESLRKAAGRPS